MLRVPNAVVRTAISFGMEVYGVRHGYNGLLTGEVQKNGTSQRFQHHPARRHGVYGAAPSSIPRRVRRRLLNVAVGIDGVVVVGGDGSFRGARDLTGAGVPCIVVPGTIDNDISSSEYTIGYDTAMNTAMEMIDRIRDTTESHDRCSVVEVMGRRCGDIALNTGIAVGAIATLVPEVQYDFEKDVIERIRYALKTGKRHFIVVVAEGVGHSEDICERIQEETGIESRATIAQPLTRTAGSPTLRDRVVASQMGYHAVELLRDGKSNRVVVMQRTHRRLRHYRSPRDAARLRRRNDEDLSGSFPLKFSHRNACSKRTGVFCFSARMSCVFCIKYLVGGKKIIFGKIGLTFSQWFVVE